MKNLLTRIIVAIIAIPGLVAVSYFGEYYFLGFVSIVGALSYYEYSEMVKNKNCRINITIGIIAVIAIILNSFFNYIAYYELIIIIILLSIIYELFSKKNSANLNLGCGLFGVLYIGFLSGALVRIREYFDGELYVNGGMVIISILATIWICDSAAYFIGTPFGKHKLMPRVSPNKSWEGAIAGFCFSIITMIAAKHLILQFMEWKDVIALGAIIGVIGQIGDLVESLLKRDVGVKDSSALIPGHGGIMDRFDSLIFSAPVIYLYLLYFFKV